MEINGKKAFRKLVNINWKYVSIVAFFAILLFACSVYIVKTGLFNIKKVEVSGLGKTSLEYVDPSQVEISLNQYIGKNFFKADLNWGIEQVKNNYPFAENVYIDKTFPNSIVVEISERTPFVVVENKSECVLLDRKSYVLKIVTDSDCKKVALSYFVQYVTVKDLNVNFKENSQSSFYLTNDLIKILDKFSSLGYDVSNLVLEDEICTVYLADQRRVIISLNQELDVELARLDIVTEEINNLSGSTVFNELDLRYKRPVIR